MWTRSELGLVPAAAIIAFLLVFLGDGDAGRDDAFKAVGALTSGFPDEYDQQGLWVTIGRVLAPFVALYATIRLVTVLYAQRIRERRVRRKKGHTIVVGLGETGLRAARHYRRKGLKVVTVTQQPFGPRAEAALRSGAYVVAGSGTEPATLHTAGVRGAARILCAEASDAVNVQVALDALEQRGAEKPIAMLVEAPEAAPAAALLGGLPGSGRVTLFSMRELWAWRLLAAGPLWRSRSVIEEAPDTVIVGGSELGSTLLLCACRWWHFSASGGRPSERLRIVLIDPDARALCDRLLLRHPELPETVDLRAVDADLAESFDEIDDMLHDDGRDWVVYVCLDASDSVRRACGRAVQQRLAGSTAGGVVVAVSEGSGRADDFVPAIREIEPDDDGQEFDHSRFDRVAELARAVHDEYELHMRETGVESAPALTPFDELPPEFKESNRAHARCIDAQLLSILRTTAPLRHWNRVAELSPAEIELLSELEHARWYDEKIAGGWSYGRKRDDERRLHPDLVSWAKVSERSRNINRALMRRRPWTLSRVGEAIVRHPGREHLARLVHETYPEHLAPASPAWHELADAERGPSFAFVDDLPAKLIRIGRRIASGQGSGSTAELTDAEIEHLVSWDDLTEDRREIDRVLVRAMPSLLTEVGLGVERVGGPPAGEASAARTPRASSAT